MRKKGIIDGSLRNLSFEKDLFTTPEGPPAIHSYEDLVIGLS